MKRIRRKLSSRRGETLIELLVSIMIIALSAFLLVMMYEASGKINLAARKMDDDLYQSVTEIGNHTGEAQKGKVQYEIQDDFEARPGEIEVEIFSDDTVVTYSKPTTP